MPDQQRHPDGHIGSLVISALFVLMGIIALYDTTGYSDRDSQVFPRTVAIIMILAAGGSMITRFLNPREAGGVGAGTWWRRILLVVAMFAGCLAIPYIGFLASGAIAFCLIAGRFIAVPVGAQVDAPLIIQIAITILLFPMATRLVAWIDRKRGRHEVGA